jgi:hypothetical protein
VRARAGGHRLTLKCFATGGGDAGLCASPPGVATHYRLRHSSWRRTPFCHATVDGDAKKGYFFEIVLPMVYFLKSFEVWVNFV